MSQLARSSSAFLSSAEVDGRSIFPYSFVLQNDSGHTIVAYSARWSATDASGRVTTHDRLYENPLTLDEGGAISPKASRLVSPLSGLNSSVAARNTSMTVKIESSIPKTIKTFSRQVSVTISLDAVVFENGLALGPDSSNSIPNLQAWMDAKREILGAVLAAGRPTAVTDYLQALSGVTSGGALAASRENSPDLAYAAFLRWHRSHLARSYLALAKSDPDAVMKVAQRYLSTSRPTVHR